MNKPVMPLSSYQLKLPKADRSIETYRLAASRSFPSKLEGTLNRVAFSAAHVVADPLADADPWLNAAVDWDRTIAFREHVWDLGLGVAEAMDTAQRGMGLDWPTSLELIQRSVRAAKARGGALVFSGAGTDHLAVEDARSLDDVIRAFEEQIAAVEKAGGRIILMASRALAKLGRNADDYAKVYDRVLSQVREPVIIHWLGDMFDPALANYWGTPSLDTAMDIAVGIINANASKVWLAFGSPGLVSVNHTTWWSLWPMRFRTRCRDANDWCELCMSSSRSMYCRWSIAGTSRRPLNT